MAIDARKQYIESDMAKLHLGPWLQWLTERHAAQCGVSEIRILGGLNRRAIYAGYFDAEHVNDLAKLIIPRHDSPRKKIPFGDHPTATEANVYATLNPVHPDLLGRINNTIQYASETTGDTDVVAYSLPLIDVDPVRKSQISASDEEKLAAYDVGQTVKRYLKDEHGIDVIWADSGNGYHLLIPAIPYTGDAIPKAAEDAKAFLSLLGERFDTDKAKIDRTVFNPARISRLYGTQTKKGADMVGVRPHRWSSVDLSHIPANIDLFGKLRQTIDDYKREQKDREAAKSKTSIMMAMSQPMRSGVSWTHEECIEVLEGVLALSGLIFRKLEKGGRTLFVFEKCPYHTDDDGDRFECAAMVESDGRYSGSCKHDANAGWKQFKTAIGWEQHKEAVLKNLGLWRSQRVKPSTQIMPDVIEPGTREEPDTRPTIFLGNYDLKIISARVWEILMKLNNPPFLYRRGGEIVRINQDDHETEFIHGLDIDGMRHVLAQVIRWLTKKRSDIVSTLPPMPVVKDTLVTPNLPLPVLTRITQVPIFSSGGKLITEPGYHPESRVFFAPAKGFKMPPLPEPITPEDIDIARTILVEELLGDFPFAGEAERAHAIALMLILYAREMIDGLIPLILIEAPSPGTGKGLLMWCLTFPATGWTAGLLTEGRDEDEWRKRITAKLRTGPSIIIFDNLRRRLDSAAVSAAITAPTWEDRILGESTIVALPVRCVWAATGNNPALSSEISRRTVRIRLDARVDRPWLRNGFRHANLSDWVKSNRGDLVWAGLVLIKAWVEAGRPPYQGSAPGMFEEWAKAIGGILQVAKIPGFLTNMADAYESSDAEGATWRAFVTAWWVKFKEKEVGVAELWEIANGLDEPLDLGQGSEKSQKTKLGKDLAQMRDRQFEDLRVTLAGTYQRAKRWKLVPVAQGVGIAGEHQEHREHLLPFDARNLEGQVDLENNQYKVGGKSSRCSSLSSTPVNGNGTPQANKTSSIVESISQDTAPVLHPISAPVNIDALPSHIATWPGYWRDLFEERAGLLESESGFSRSEAETLAEQLVREEFDHEKNGAPA